MEVGLRTTDVFCFDTANVGCISDLTESDILNFDLGFEFPKEFEENESTTGKHYFISIRPNTNYIDTRIF
jgi:hypothetical protein